MVDIHFLTDLAQESEKVIVDMASVPRNCRVYISTIAGGGGN